MTATTTRGQATRLTLAPRSWMGPLPDLSIRRRLPELDGYARVPVTLLRTDAPDLGVLTWAWLRLAGDNRPQVATYQDFAAAFGLNGLSGPAIEQRFTAALKPLLGVWIIRKRLPGNRRTYKAVEPKSKAHRAAERYAMIRRADISLLVKGGSRNRLKISDVVDFARWQLACGKRGWTADSIDNLAQDWGVSATTLRRSRTRLAAAGLLRTTARSGVQLSDFIWLGELHDPHWTIAAPVAAAGSQAAEPNLEGEQSDSQGGSQQMSEEPDLVVADPGFGVSELMGSVRQKPWVPSAKNHGSYRKSSRKRANRDRSIRARWCVSSTAYVAIAPVGDDDAAGGAESQHFINRLGPDRQRRPRDQTQ